MRLTTIASAAVLALSTAALAQVGSTPVEDKLSTNNTADDAAPSAGNTADASAASEPGAPSTALVNSAEGEPPTPVGNQTSN